MLLPLPFLFSLLFVSNVSWQMYQVSLTVCWWRHPLKMCTAEANPVTAYGLLRFAFIPPKIYVRTVCILWVYWASLFHQHPVVNANKFQWIRCCLCVPICICRATRTFQNNFSISRRFSLCCFVISKYCPNDSIAFWLVMFHSWIVLQWSTIFNATHTFKTAYQNPTPNIQRSETEITELDQYSSSLSSSSSSLAFTLDKSFQAILNVGRLGRTQFPYTRFHN